jgi:glycosyltransferase involved in cell wall biosynthesis
VQPIVAIDARDAAGSELRGWGRYVLELIRALEAGAADGLELQLLWDGGRGPEVLFEQIKLPLSLRRSRAAIVHAPNCFLPLARPCPGVVTINDLAFETWPSDFAPLTRWKYRVLARAAARSAERVICPSSFTRDDVCERWGIDPDKARVIPDAPALAARGPSVQDGGPAVAGASEAGGAEGPYVLAVGDLRRKKNLEALVAAFVELRRTDAIPHRLVLAGVDSGAGARLLELAGDAPLELTGYVSDERLDGLIREAELLVHPSLYEGFGLVVLEAMVRGTPVLAARATALPETGGDAAAYFDPADPGDLTAALGSLLSDGAARAELSRRGLEWASQFSWERTARETVAVYRELV